MAINPETQYPGKIAPSTPGYPYGAARNISLPGDGTGTPWEAALVNDLFGFQQALLSEAGAVPSGSPDRVGASQYFDSLAAVAGRVFPTIAAAVAKELVAGLKVFTTGYYSAGGAGGGHYIVQTAAQYGATPDELRDHTLPNGNILVLVPVFNYLSVTQCGARGDGATNDSPSFVSALGGSVASVSVSGATAGFVLDDSFTVPVGKALVGSYEFIDPRNGAEFNDTNYPDRILLNSAATITLDESASLRGLPIIRKGSVFPANAAEVANFAGTAVKFEALKVGQYVGHCAIVGFNVAVQDDEVDNTEQWRCEYLNIDCNNGILGAVNFDIVYVENVHCWPTASVGVPGVVDADLRRPGVAFRFKGGGDWNRWTNCFSFGYQNGFVNDGCNSVIALTCGADYTVTQSSNPIGFQCINDAAEMTLIGCQAAGQAIGYYINSSSANNHVELIGCNSWEADGHHVLNDNGQVFINGGRIRGGSAAGVTPNDNGPTILSGVSFESTGGPAINNQSTSNIVRWDNMCTFNVATIAVNPYKPQVASAAAVVLNGEDLFFEVTGITSFGTLNDPASYAGKMVTLSFVDVLTVFDGGNMNLSGDFVTSAGDTLTLVSIGASWVEVARSVN